MYVLVYSTDNPWDNKQKVDQLKHMTAYDGYKKD